MAPSSRGSVRANASASALAAAPTERSAVPSVPIQARVSCIIPAVPNGRPSFTGRDAVRRTQDRKSTRLNSSHLVISYAVFCLKKKKNNHGDTWTAFMASIPDGGIVLAELESHVRRIHRLAGIELTLSVVPLARARRQRQVRVT